MVEFKAMMEAITKLTEVVTGMQQREMTNVKPPGLERKKIDVRFMKVQEFDGRNDEWDSWSFSFKSSIRAQDTRAKGLLVHAELETSEISENGLNAGDEMISGEVYNLLCQYCRGSAQSILRTVEDCRGLVAWQKLHRVYNPMTVARTIQALGEVTLPPCVTDISLAEGAISKWEEMLKKVDRDFKQTIGDHMRIAILANFMPLVIKEYIYVNVQPDTQYKVIIDKVKTLIRNKVTTGAVPMDIGHVQAGERDCAEDEPKGCPGEHYDVDALGFRGRCNNCGGWGHFARECELNSIIRNGLIPGGKSLKRGRQVVFFTPVNPMEDGNGMGETHAT